MAYLDQMLSAWELLGEREKKILATLAMRLYAGQRRHGKLSEGKKDWTYEALEEALDMAVYMACALNDKTDKAFQAMVTDAEQEAANRTVGQLALDSTENTAAEPYGLR